MNLLFFINISVSFVFLIKTVISIQEIKLNNLTFKTLIPLLNVLSKDKNDVAYVKIEPNKSNHKTHVRNRNEKTNSLNEIIDDYLVKDKKFVRPGKHILIKRILPHGLEPSTLEYDNKYGTFYRPLVRVHKRKPMPKISTIMNIDGNTNNIDKYGIDTYDYYDNDENVIKFATNKDRDENMKHFQVKQVGESFNVDEELMQPFNTKFPRNYKSLEELSTNLRVLEDIHNLLKRLRSSSTTADSHREIIKVLDKISSLRSQEKSGEDNDPLAPGKLVINRKDDTEHGPSQPKKWMQHYPPWNFWTYKKSIYQDVCPRGQVKINNLCIAIPPH